MARHAAEEAAEACTLYAAELAVAEEAEMEAAAKVERQVALKLALATLANEQMTPLDEKTLQLAMAQLRFEMDAYGVSEAQRCVRTAEQQGSSGQWLQTLVS